MPSTLFPFATHRARPKFFGSFGILSQVKTMWAEISFHKEWKAGQAERNKMELKVIEDAEALLNSTRRDSPLGHSQRALGGKGDKSNSAVSSCN